MIQAISPSNVQSNMSAQPLKPQSFKQGPMCNHPPKRDKPSFGDKLSWAGGQFAAGAVVGAIFNGIGDLVNVISKKAPASPFKEYARQAGVCGLAFLVVGIVFEALNASRRRKEQ